MQAGGAMQWAKVHHQQLLIHLLYCTLLYYTVHVYCTSFYKTFNIIYYTFQSVMSLDKEKPRDLSATG